MISHVRMRHICRLTILLLLFISFNNAKAQTPNILFQKTIGGSTGDAITDIRPTTDGGYIAVGTSNSNISGDKTENNLSNSANSPDVWVVKLDANGTIQWENTIGGDTADIAKAVIQTPDGGYLVGASSMSNISDDKTENSFGSMDYWVIKLDANGIIQWQRTLGGAGIDRLNALTATTDGGFLVGGYSSSNISGNKSENSLGSNDFWVVKLGANGATQWQKTLGTDGSDVLMGLQQTTDGGYILGGYTFDMTGLAIFPRYGAQDFYLIKIDAVGTLQWHKAYGGTFDDLLEAVQQTTDGGYILGGYSTSNVSGIKSEDSNGGSNGDYWIVKVDAAGTMQWQNTIGGSSLDYLKSLSQTADGGYILGGYSYSTLSGDKTEVSQGGGDYWIVKTNNVGSVEWQKTIGSSSNDVVLAIRATLDGNYIIAGSTDGNISGDKTDNSKGSSDFWIIKLSDPGALNTPSVSDVNYCPNETAQPLTAIGQDLLWYTTLTGGVGSTTAPTPTTTTPGRTLYYVSQTINNVESPRAIINVVVKTPSSVTISGLGAMCAGTSQSIAAYAGTAFVWNDGVTTGTRTIAPTTTTTYTVTVTGINGCTNTGSRTFYVSAPPVASISGLNSICNGTNTTLTASPGSNDLYYGYRWNTGQTTAAITVAPNTTRTYTVTITMGSCTSVATKTITVNGVAPSSMSIVGLGTSYVKTAPAVTLVGSPTGGTFRVNNQVRTTFNPSQLAVGNHTVTYTITQGGCNSVITRTVTVTASTTSLLAANATTLNAQVEAKRIKLVLSNNTGEANEYFEVQKMDANGNFNTIETIKAKDNFRNNDINYYTFYDNEPAAGVNIYRINIVFIDGQSTKTEPRSIKFEALKDIQAYPNPAVDELDVNLEKYVGKAVIIKMYNQLGAEVMSDKIDEVSATIRKMDISNLQDGNYILRVASPNVRDAVLKIVVNK